MLYDVLRRIWTVSLFCEEIHFSAEMAKEIKSTIVSRVQVKNSNKLACVTMS